jgi:hypothetical protein
VPERLLEIAVAPLNDPLLLVEAKQPDPARNATQGRVRVERASLELPITLLWSRGHGKYVGGTRLHPRYGYRLQKRPEGKWEYVPVPEEQAVIDEMVRLRAKGMTLSGVCAALEDEGVPGPTGKGWSEPTVHRILKREGAAA